MVNTEIRLIIVLSSQRGKKRWPPKMESAKRRLGTDCGSDHELLIAKFRLKLKKVGKTTRPFRYDLSQIPYDYTVEVKNRFKGLDLIEYLKNYRRWFMTLYRIQWSRLCPQNKKCEKAKWLSEEALQMAMKRREMKGKWEKERYTHFECRVPKNSKET